MSDKTKVEALPVGTRFRHGTGSQLGEVEIEVQTASNANGIQDYRWRPVLLDGLGHWRESLSPDYQLRAWYEAREPEAADLTQEGVDGLEVQAQAADDLLASFDAPVTRKVLDATVSGASGGDNPDDLAKLLGLLAQHEQSFHKGKPFDLKRAIAVVEELAEAREELWNHIGRHEGVTNAVYQTPEDLAEMLHDAYEGADHSFAKHEAEWDDLPESRRAVYLAMAEHVIDQLLRGGL